MVQQCSIINRHIIISGCPSENNEPLQARSQLFSVLPLIHFSVREKVEREIIHVSWGSGVKDSTEKNGPLAIRLREMPIIFRRVSIYDKGSVNNTVLVCHKKIQYFKREVSICTSTKLFPPLNLFPHFPLDSTVESSTHNYCLPCTVSPCNNFLHLL